MQEMGEGGIGCESGVQSLRTWVMVVLLAMEGKVCWNSVWIEGVPYFSMLHLKVSHSPQKRARLKASHPQIQCTIFS